MTTVTTNGNKDIMNITLKAATDKANVYSFFKLIVLNLALHLIKLYTSNVFMTIISINGMMALTNILIKSITVSIFMDPAEHVFVVWVWFVILLKLDVVFMRKNTFGICNNMIINSIMVIINNNFFFISENVLFIWINHF